MYVNIPRCDRSLLVSIGPMEIIMKDRKGLHTLVSVYIWVYSIQVPNLRLEVIIIALRS